MRVGLPAVATLLSVAFGAIPAARGDFLIYTESFTASGSLGNADFTNKAVTLTVYGDTSTLFRIPTVAVVSADAADATVGIAGLATATFTDVLSVFDAYNPNFGGLFGISDQNSPNDQGDILDVQASPFLTYDLISPIGPISATFDDPPGGSVLNNPNATDAGDLVFTSVGAAVTVRVMSLTSVPEPSSVLMVGIGLAGMAGIGLRRQPPRLA